MRLKNVARVVVALALLSAFGCTSKNKGKIEGTKWSSLAGMVKGNNILEAGTPVSFEVLCNEIKGLALNIELEKRSL